MTATVRQHVDALLAQWAWCIDHAHFDELAELFTQDARFLTQGSVLEGRQQIRARYAARAGVRTTRHTYSGLHLLQSSTTTASATSVWVCYAANRPAPVDEVGVYLVADFNDEFTLEQDGRWRISAREIVPVFRDAERKPVSA